MAALLKDPKYRAYFLRSPQLPAKLYHPAPFKVWALKPNGKWAGVALPDFPSAFTKAKAILKSPTYIDVSISSRVIGFRAPEELARQYRADGYDWCLMCRRPVLFMPKRKHHALRDDLHRYFVAFPVCPYCGIREETMTTPGMITMGKN